MGSASSSNSDPKYEASLPEKYVVLKQLGEGGYGKVEKCLDLEAKKIVAVKTSIHKEDLRNEASMMKLLMENNLDEKNIVKYYEELSTDDHLAYEVLDSTLSEYLIDREAPMCLQDIRVVIQQLATAFDGLKSTGVIHTDIKANNIMLVDQARQPFKVKLIDFGLAVLSSNAKKTRIIQAPAFRAPEVILGLPYSEALDIWSLGCVMAFMVFGFSLFPGRTSYELLQYITDIIGLPPVHLINAGKKSKTYFKKTDLDQWTLKEPKECWEADCDARDRRRYTFRSLDDMKQMRLEEDNMAEADERRECIELLKAMLRWDEKERITPSEILAHPFITGQYPSRGSHLSSCNEVGTSMNQAAEIGMKNPEKTTKTNMDQAAEPVTQETNETSNNQAARPSTQEPPVETQGLNTHFTTVQPAAAVMVRLPSVQIMVQQAPLENRIQLLRGTSNQEFDCDRGTLAPVLTETDCSPAAAAAINQDHTEDHKEDNAEDNRNHHAGDNTENHTEDNRDNHTGDNTNNHTEDNAENNTENHTGDNTNNHTEDNRDNHTGDNTNNHTRDNTNNHTEDNAENNTGDNTEDQKEDHTEASEPKRKKKKKTKHSIRHFLLWWKKTFCCYSNVE